ncbi:MAG: haloacid dehalogenase-like hydrolase [Syntrophus sp. PtaU1.Bin208]|nr:MAG: haloacid dehalogenase-like hydrolase [Syntrophus sp. PtaU1.Bin208]
MEQGNKDGSNIEVVLFDFGGVLAEEGWKQGFRAIAEANGLNGDDLVQVAGDTVYATGYITGRGSESSFWQAMREQKGVRGNDASLNYEIVSRFIPREWMFDLVKRLKADERTVGILSDQTDILDKLNARFDFFRYFDFVFNSYHIGKGKRDRSLFDDIARLLKTEPARILFVDDDPGNVERARQSGWQALLYVDRNSFCAAMEKMLLIQ